MAVVADSALALARRDRARERTERERRRSIVARLRFIESNLTAAEIVIALAQAMPPIVTSIRTVTRDIAAVRDDCRRYLSPGHFDAPFEISASLLRHEMIARRATQRALDSNDADGARWAKIAIRATQARTELLMDVGLIDRNVGTLLLASKDAGTVDRIPSGLEMQKIFDGVVITEDDLTSDAERSYMAYGDADGVERARKRLP